MRQSPMEAFELFAETDPKKALDLAKNLEKINKDRKLKVANIMKEVKKTLALREEKSLIVIGNPLWHPGLAGLVASKIIDEFKKPVFVWGSDPSGEIRGSCRAPGGVNLVDIMTAVKDSFSAFGGHALAGGFSVKREEIHFLEEKLIKVFDDISGSVYEADASYNIDCDMLLDDVNENNFKVVSSLAPFGAGNPKPVFRLPDIAINEVKLFGKEKNHLELSFFNSRGKIIKAVAFFKTDKDYPIALSSGSRITLIANFEKNTFAGRTELRLRIAHIL